jgi:enediyne biosynthesis protein E8
MTAVATAELSRRRLLQIVSAAALAVPLAGLRMPEARAVPLPLSLDAETLTLEAWSDTMVPGAKRSADDRAIAGATAGPGAVQAGAVDMMRFGPVGLAPELLEDARPDQLAWYGLAGIAMLAFHTAGHLSTADAVRSGHPGLAWIDFPLPDADGLWRYPVFSYRRTLAAVHPATTSTGQPA